MGIRPASKIGHLSLLLCALSLAACGDAQSPRSSAATSAALRVELPAPPVDLSAVAAEPRFHVAPVLLEEPNDIDAANNDASALLPPHIAYVPAALAQLSTRRLTREVIEETAYGGVTTTKASDDPRATPLAAGTAVATYTPAQIRAAYGMTAIPAAGTNIAAAAAAQLGAGQTIYIIDAMNDPNVAAELAAFDRNFGLPTCIITAIAPNAALPLAPAPTSGCSLSVVYTTTAGEMTAAAPAYDSGWSTEISLDVQWSHATAPLARIILIEAPDSSLNSLLGAVELANAMGPGIVSMSFGSPEGSWTASVDASFTAANMSYLAATGDAGAGVDWPAVSAHVLGVGATTLTYSGSAPRSEIAWIDTGGGISAYTPAPTYQATAVPGMGLQSHRNVADVAFNGDPSTGQYVAVMSPNSTNVGWVSAGGTSLATPQWAGLLAIANAVRAQSADGALGAPQALLYGQVASNTNNYSKAFADITRGSDGSCATCSAKTGYDDLSGLGTPNAAALLQLLEGTTAQPAAPAITSASISGTSGTPLSFTVTASAPHPLAYRLGAAPAGMSISSAGVVTWPAPSVGTCVVSVTVVDSVTGLSATGTYTVAITVPAPPVVAAASVTGTAAVALTFQVQVTTSNPVSLSLSGAPSGMTLSSAGLLAWADPIQGAYKATVSAKDTKTGLIGQGIVNIVISPPQPPMVTSTAVSGRVGTALNFTVAARSADPLKYALAGAPVGMTISSTGSVSWPTPIVGVYAVHATATDTMTGLSGQGIYTVTISAAGPVITATPITGVAGHAVSNTINITDASSNSVSLAISGVPSGVTFSPSGAKITMNWANPVTGSYSLQISATDSAGLSAKSTLPITITAH
jgi:hypothetical protein